MAGYSVQVQNNTITPDGMCQASCMVTVVVPTVTNPEMYMAGIDVVVAFGSSPAQTNTNILNAAIAEVKRAHGIATNAGGNDRTALFGGRNA